jgi:hypothetical protein
MSARADPRRGAISDACPYRDRQVSDGPRPVSLTAGETRTGNRSRSYRCGRPVHPSYCFVKVPLTLATSVSMMYNWFPPLAMAKVKGVAFFPFPCFALPLQSEFTL